MSLFSARSAAAARRASPTIRESCGQLAPGLLAMRLKYEER
jgi:hypothetical protein